MALIDAGVNSSRTKKAEEAIQPLRAALVNYRKRSWGSSRVARSVRLRMWMAG
jgi:hypothetical protein